MLRSKSLVFLVSYCRNKIGKHLGAVYAGACELMDKIA